MKSFVRSTLRKGYRATKKWVAEQHPRDPLEEERQRFPKFAYGELNAMLLQILQKAGDQVRSRYTWGVLHAAHLAKAVGVSRISVIEFGVAGGKGLISLERTAEEVQAVLGVEIEVYGFDTGKGLPRPQDYRDQPNMYAPSTYSMDPSKLKAQLKGAKLILGLIRESLPEFLKARPAPVGFISVDVDLYSSTVDVLKILEADFHLLLPRVHGYFDDIMGFNACEFVGERLAIAEFNQAHTLRKIAPIPGLWHFVPRALADELWTEMMYMAHILDHPVYNTEDGLVRDKFENL
jgi:hypothetical protein